MKYVTKPRDPETGEYGGWATWTVLEDELLEPFLRGVDGDHGPGARDLLKVEDIDEYLFDGGGMVSMDEAVVSVEVKGMRFSAYLRHIEFFTPSLRQRGGNMRDCFGDDYVFVGCFQSNIILTYDTARKAADLFDLELMGREGEVDATWDGLKGAIDKCNEGGKKAFMVPREEQKKRQKDKLKRQQ